MENIEFQKTIQKPVSLKGLGLHTGNKCSATFLPAPENAGIRFVRIDLPGRPAIAASIENVVDVVRGTTLGIGDIRVYTIEHLMSAFNGLGIDNITIEVDSSEPPVMDGSAQEILASLKQSGVVEQKAPKAFYYPKESFEYHSHQTIIRIDPSAKFEIQCETDYDHPIAKRQIYSFRRGDDYEKEVAPARTFCFDYEIESLQKNGLAKGGSLENAIVIGMDGIYNQSPLRFENEFARHKTLDLMGDLMLIGQPLRAKITALRCGHGHNIKFIKQLLQRRSASPRVSVG